MNNFTKKELAILQKYKTPAKIQDYLNTIPFNFETNGITTVKSPKRTLREQNAHCMEGALLGAYMLSLHGYEPLLLHLKSTKSDFDHIIVPFKENGFWGALSKTNHAVLRYREPVYKTIRELALSYFHEYFTNNGVKTLRQYSDILSLNEFEDGWELEEEDLWGIDEELDLIRHHDIVPTSYVRKLRKADFIERKAGEIVEWEAQRRANR